MTTPHTEADRLEFESPQPFGLLTALCLALLIHVLLFLGLATGPNWKRGAELPILQVELWPTLPKQAAPELVEVSPLVRTTTMPIPSSQEAREIEQAIERARQRDQEQHAERNKLLLEQQQQHHKEKEAQEAREQRERKENCLSLEEAANRDGDQTSNSGKSDGRVPCVEG